MKKIIIPIGIIAGAIVLFSLIGCKQSNLCKGVENVQVERQDPNRQLESSSVTEAKPVIGSIESSPKSEELRRTEPLAKVKSENNHPETTPVTEANQEAKHTIEPKLVETSDFSAKPMVNPAPIALPVVMPPKAEELNAAAEEYALMEKEKREPFFHLYKDAHLESVTFEGTIRATSTIPDPTTKDYDNCLYALFMELDSFVFNNQALKQEMPCEVIITVPIMKDKIIDENNVFLPGDKVLCTCAEYDDMPQSIQEIQFSDDIQSFEHQQYYVLTINKINAFSLDGSKDFAKREITILPIQKLSKNEKAAKQRKERIQSEIARIEAEIEEHGGSFGKWKEEYKTIAEQYKQLCDEDWKGWINDSFFSAFGPETTYNTKEYIEGITPYKDYLEQNNIDLIIVRFPSKWDFAARVLCGDTFQENPAWVEHYYECLKNDIEIVDPMPELYQHRFDYNEFYYYQVPGEIHPHDGYSFVAAQVLSDLLERYSYEKDSSIYELKKDTTYGASKKDFYPSGNDRFDPNLPMTVKSIHKDGKRMSCNMIGSPFLIISNSLFQFPVIGRGAAFPQYLAFHLHITPDILVQQGQNNAMLRSLVSNSTVLSRRAAVIMPGGFFMWKGFPPFPKYLFDNPKTITLEKTIDFFEYDNVKLSYDANQFEISNEAGVLSVERKGNKALFSLSFDIASVPNKTVCMVRVILKKHNAISITVKDSNDDSIIEPECEADHKQSDLFVPMADKAKNITLIFKFLGTNDVQIEKIELWYY